MYILAEVTVCNLGKFLLNNAYIPANIVMWLISGITGLKWCSAVRKPSYHRLLNRTAGPTVKDLYNHNMQKYVLTKLYV